MMNIQLGYHINQSQSEEKKALQEGFELVRKARELGQQTRTWARQTNDSCKLLLQQLKKDAGGSIEMRLWDVSCLESKILQTLRTYMSDSADLMSGLKPLNPPLRSEQIKPLMQAMILDRNTTAAMIDPLTKTIAELTAYKLDLNNARGGSVASDHPYKP